MDYRTCGRSGLELSVIGLGCWAFGGGEYWGRQDQSDVDAVVRAAFERGVTYFDTAEAYNEGRSEISLGQALRGLPRERIIIGSKVAPAHCYPEMLERHCEASLERLGTDYIDLYMIHWPIHAHSIRHYTNDAKVIANPPRADAAFEALERLRERGKIRHIGVSNFSKNRLQADIPAELGVAANQLPYNLLCRAIEFDTLPACRAAGIGIIGYMTLLQGILTGKYKNLSDVPEWQRRSRHFNCAGTPRCRHGEAGFEPETEAALAAIKTLANEAGMSMGELATRWAIAEPAVSCALTGARNEAQLAENLKAAEGALDPALVESLREATGPLRDAMGNHFDYYESRENDRTL